MRCESDCSGVPCGLVLPSKGRVEGKARERLNLVGGSDLGIEVGHLWSTSVAQSPEEEPQKVGANDVYFDKVRLVG